MIGFNEEVLNKWKPVLEHSDLPKITDAHRRNVTATLLENTEKAIRESGGSFGNHSLLETATNAAGTGGFGGIANVSGAAGYDPILISLIRRAMPNLIAYDVCGVQPMTGPTGLIFAMRSQYANSSAKGTEAFYDEANTMKSTDQFAGVGTAGIGGNNVGTVPTGVAATYNFKGGMNTSTAEAMGVAAESFPEMAFSIDKVSVTAQSRALKAEYTMELAQDLKAVHGLDAETELANILSTEILAEINREVVRTVYRSAVVGAQYGVTTAGTFDLDTDSNGRWSVEKFKGLVFQIERECNAISKATRRGKGNILIVSSDVASALAMAGVLDYTPALNVNLTVDDTGNTFAGTMHGRVKVYIDPYFGGSSNGDELCTVGYKGTSPYDAGLFYCPYVPLQMVRAIGQDTFQPKIGFKTRYGMVANPFAKGLTALTDLGDSITDTVRSNNYYRIFRVRNLT